MGRGSKIGNASNAIAPNFVVPAAEATDPGRTRDPARPITDLNKSRRTIACALAALAAGV
jgi:hypothetical protein